MLLSIKHTLTYQYSMPVFIEPHLVRLTPASDYNQRVLDHQLSIEPAPSGTSANIDLEGNPTATAWFSGSQESLRIESKSLVETLRENPFIFLVTSPESARLPVTYPLIIREALTPYLRVDPPAGAAAYAAETALTSSGDTLQFLSAITSRMNDEFEQIVRDTGAPWAPDDTLEKKEGSCRDLTVLFMEACRSQGLASRFVSGYWYAKEAKHNHLHAWAEVYLPGAGWRGYDPSSGIAVADQHVRIAAGWSPDLTNPAEGNFRGTGATSKMDYVISVNEVTETG